MKSPRPASALGVLGVVAALSSTACGSRVDARQAPPPGRVLGPDGGSAPAVFVTARLADAPMAISTRTDANGSYDLGPLPDGSWTIRAHGPGVASAEASVTGGSAYTAPELRLAARPASLEDLPGSSFLGLLPDGEAKRRFLLDCTGCHVFDHGVAMPGGTARAHNGWIDAVGRMLGFAGPASSFPVISIGRTPAATADFLSAAITPDATRALRPPSPTPPVPGDAAVITEYDIPEPGDLPHDLALTADGHVVITGMFTHRMYVLDPATGAFETVDIPVPNANPRAVEIDVEGDWWVVLGNPQRVARYDVSERTWSSWPAGMYAHSIGIGPDGRAWFNGHFTRDPERIGYAGADGRVETFIVPPHPRAAQGFGPIPYELRIAPDGRVWMSELAGNRVHAFDPATSSFRTFEMPRPASGPRRFDIATDGIVWIPEYAAGALARLDPVTGDIREFPLPIADAAPYVARMDPRDGAVWLGTGMADALLRFDPRTGAFTTWPLPTHGALVRHIAVAPNGDVWAAYGASPGIPGKVARLRRRAR